MEENVLNLERTPRADVSSSVSDLLHGILITEIQSFEKMGPDYNVYSNILKELGQRLIEHDLITGENMKVCYYDEDRQDESFE